MVLKNKLKSAVGQKKEIEKTIQKPYRKVKTTDVRRSKNAPRRNESATAYIKKDGAYVVRNDKTGDVVQISDKNDPNWKSPFKRK